jgi:hypothetical protein
MVKNEISCRILTPQSARSRLIIVKENDIVSPSHGGRDMSTQICSPDPLVLRTDKVIQDHTQ